MTDFINEWTLPEPETCEWEYRSSGGYETGCGGCFYFADDRYNEGFKFCPYCGNPIKEKVPNPDDPFGVERG